LCGAAAPGGEFFYHTNSEPSAGERVIEDVILSEVAHGKIIQLLNRKKLEPSSYWRCTLIFREHMISSFTVEPKWHFYPVVKNGR